MATPIPNEIRDFLEKMVVDKGISNPSPELHQDMIESLFQRLQAYLFTDVVKNLSQADAQELNQKIEQGELTPDQSLEWLKSRVKNISKILADSMAEFRNIYLAA